VAFKIANDVKPMKNYRNWGEFVGYKGNGIHPTCCIGRFSFSNAISATVFSYLNQKSDVPLDGAIAAVVSIETQMSKTGALADSVKLTPLDALAAVVPAAKVAQVGQKITSGLGSATMAMQVDDEAKHHANNPLNPHTPKSGGGTWTGGTLADEYATFAVLFWKKVPTYGPCYRIGTHYNS